MIAQFMQIMNKLKELGADSIEIAYVWEATKGVPDEKKVYEVLREINLELAEAFSKEMTLEVWRSDLRREHFNRKRISDSLVRETGISKGLAEKIAKEVEEKIKSSEMGVITSSLVRELVLSRLIELGMLEEYKKYARIGLPVFDLERFLQRRNVGRNILEKIFSQYVILHVLPKASAELVLDGVLCIKGMGLPYAPYAEAYVLKTPNLKRWVSGLFKYLGSEFVDMPSIYIPPHFQEELRAIIEALRENAILWSEEKIPGCKVSKKPVFTFGVSDFNPIIDIFEVNLARLAEVKSSPTGFKIGIDDLLKGINAYVDFKKRFVKKGDFYIILHGISRASSEIFIPEEKILSFFEEYNVICPQVP